MEQRIHQIKELDESRKVALDQSLRHQESMKGTFDKSARPRSFQIEDTVLLWDKRKKKPEKHGKFDSLWKGSFIIRDTVGTNSFFLNTMDGEILNLPMNGQHLKPFIETTSKMTKGSSQGFSKPILVVFLCTLCFLYYIFMYHIFVECCINALSFCILAFVLYFTYIC